MGWRWCCEVFPRWKPGEKERWEEMSQNGRFHYVFVRGVLIYGGWGTFAMTFLMHMSPEFDTPLGELFLTNAAIWLVVGALYGQGTWWGTSKSYEEHFGPQETSADS